MIPDSKPIQIYGQCGAEAIVQTLSVEKNLNAGLDGASLRCLIRTTLSNLLQDSIAAAMTVTPSFNSVNDFSYKIK